ncbi:hypothetical protein [Agromyces subbeticus]|uniref:hypothetical protein n=1 Tax=Agromyces subbeticus TaxID=293890 RepID=UPI0003B683E9|nr:hypothetical protein [Agromyces subbeticus]
MSTQKRQPAGQPIGGQFAQEPRGESTISLGPSGRTLEERDVRRTALENGGYVSPMAGRALDAPASSEGRGQWWDTHFVRAEYQQVGAGYPQMPDDYTPSMTSGHSISGNRRTHRMAYAGAGVTLRMPSVTSLKRFADEQHGRTFDVPVSAEFPGGTVSGWVRVTRHGKHEWSVSGLGFGEQEKAYVTEAVSAVLEARRPSRALAQVGNLLERRRARFAAGGTKIDPTERSSFISGVGYDRGSGSMLVKIGSRSYGYKVSMQKFEAVRGAKHPGQAYNAIVKGQTRTEIASCEKCSRFYSAGTAHRCPSRHRDPSEAPSRQNLAARARATKSVV